MLIRKFFYLISIIAYFSFAEGQLIRCSNNPCKNGGRCVDQPGTFYGYNCVCQGSWTGINCDQYKGSNYGVNNNQNNNYPYNNNNPNNNYPNANYPNNNYPNNNINNNYPYNNNNNNNNYPNNQNNYNPNYNNQYNNYPNNNPYGQLTNPCMSSPCFNGGRCQPNGRDSYFCLCNYGSYGNRCEKIDNPKGKLLAIILGTILPFFAIVIIISIIVFCCCCRRRKN